MTNGDLGANEWLVDEMFESYQKDPNSVDPAWVEYFRKNGRISGAATSAPVNTPANTPVGNPIAGAPNGGVPPTPKAQVKPVVPAAPVAAAPVTQAAPAQPVQVTQQEVFKERGKTEPTPADPQVKPAPVVAAVNTIEPFSNSISPLFHVFTPCCIHIGKFSYIN